MIEYTNSEIRNKIDELIHSERNRDLLKRRLIDGLTYERLAEEFDMSVRQVKYYIQRAGKSVKILFVDCNSHLHTPFVKQEKQGTAMPCFSFALNLHAYFIAKQIWHCYHFLIGGDDNV